MIELYDYQKAAVSRMSNGCVLCGGVGSGKSRTAIAYYFLKNGGEFEDSYTPMDDHDIPDLYIITTAKKRDTLEWEGELSPFLLSPNSEVNLYSNHVCIDSWNNIGKYKDIKNAFFIFDEQRVSGSGVWVKHFLKITQSNEWILLSATPGDKWEDYIPVFIANGYYRNRSEFVREHIVYDPRVKFPKVIRYLNTERLIRLRNNILVDMDFKRKTVRHCIDVPCEYDRTAYKDILKNRWNGMEQRPYIGGTDLCMALRKLINTSPSRGTALIDILKKRKKVIVFYNFDCELDILRTLPYPKGTKTAEWNGHKHENVPDGDIWIYFVQYSSGCEGWNCIETDTIVFWSLNYSYRTTEQAKGRIDRLNTPYIDLYYFFLLSDAPIDISISECLNKKKDFNEAAFERKLRRVGTIDNL